MPMCSWWGGRRGPGILTLLPFLQDPQHCVPRALFTSTLWPPQLVPGHSPHRGPPKYLPTSHLLQPSDSITSGSLLAPLHVDLKPCSRMPWASGEQHFFPKPTWALFGSQPKRLVQAGRGEITTNCKFLKKNQPLSFL